MTSKTAGKQVLGPLHPHPRLRKHLGPLTGLLQTLGLCYVHLDQTKQNSPSESLPEHWRARFCVVQTGLEYSCAFIDILSRILLWNWFIYTGAFLRVSSKRTSHRQNTFVLSRGPKDMPASFTLSHNGSTCLFYYSINFILLRYKKSWKEEN